MEIMMPLKNLVPVARVPSSAITLKIHSFKKYLLSGSGIRLDTIFHSVGR